MDNSHELKLHENLRKSLKVKQLTAAKLSRESGVSTSTLGNWLSGCTPRDLTQLRSVADILGLSVDALCFGDTKIEPRTVVPPTLHDFEQGIFEVVLRRCRPAMPSQS